MKPMKQIGKRFLASVLSAALFTSSAAAALTRTTPVKAEANNDYYQALALSLYLYDANACGNDVDNGPLTWRGNCHTYDEFPGGYHDAGDHIKFNLTMGFAGSSLAMADYLNPGVFEKAGCKDHLIAILKRNADYLMSTTILNGDSVEKIAHVVADGNVDHGIWSSPEVQDYPRQVYYLTAGSNNSAVCGEMAAALAGTAYVVQDSDPAYAETCIKYAKALVNFGKNNVGNNMDGLAGFYDTEAQYQDEIAVAEAWLWLCGAGSKPTLVPEGGGKYSEGAGYDGYRYCWNKVFQGYAAMMYKATGDSMWATELQTEIDKQGGLRVGTYNGDGWGAARYNCALQMSGYAVANGDTSNQYAEAGKWQMDYILGENPTGYSFLIGYGSKWPTHYHHRAANPGDGDPAKNPEAKYTLYGALVGGIDASGQYEDKTDGYQYTEPALDYNGCFVLACAGLAGLYGGSDAGASKIVGSASEVTYPFDFGSGAVTPPTPTESEDPKDTEATDKDEPTNPTPTEKPSEGTKPGTFTESGNAKWTLDVTGATKVKITCKTNSNDTEMNGIFTANGANTDWKTTASGGTYTVEYEVPEGLTSLDFQVWWPTTTTIESVELTVKGAVEETTDPVEPTTEKPTEKEPDTTEKEPDTTEKTDTEVNYGDLDGDGVIKLTDVITLNRFLMNIDTNLSDQALANADVNEDNAVDAYDALNILMCVIELISPSDFPIH